MAVIKTLLLTASVFIQQNQFYSIDPASIHTVELLYNAEVH